MALSDLTFQELVPKIWSGRPEKKTLEDLPNILIALDPGETTGFAVFKGLDLIESGQLDTKDIDKAPMLVVALFDKYKPSGPIEVVIEDYKVYGYKTKDHAWSNLHTPKFIGALNVICNLNDIPYTMRMAQLVKQFTTDDKLKKWDFYVRGEQHARDAIRHGVYHIIFHPPKKRPKN